MTRAETILGLALCLALVLHGAACSETRVSESTKVSRSTKASKSTGVQQKLSAQQIKDRYANRKRVSGRDPAPGEMPAVARPRRSAPKRRPEALKGHPVPWGPEQGMPDPFEGHPRLPDDFKPNWEVVSITVYNPQELGPRIFTFKKGSSDRKPVYRIDGKLQTRKQSARKRLVVGVYSLYYGDALVNNEHVHCDMENNAAETLATFSCVGGTTNIRNTMKYAVKRSGKRMVLRRLDTKNARRDHGPLAMTLSAI